jgi:hypothetical protein
VAGIDKYAVSYTFKELEFKTNLNLVLNRFIVVVVAVVVVVVDVVVNDID